MHFLGLVEVFDDEALDAERMELIGEASQLKRIFSGILVRIAETDKMQTAQTK